MKTPLNERKRMMNATIEHGRKHMRNDSAQLSYEDAVVVGQGIYWPSSPCCRGHLYWRYTKSKACLSCVAVWTSQKRRKKSGSSRMVDLDHKLEEKRQREEDNYLDEK